MASRLVDELRRRTDGELVALLGARPDLAVPVPDDVGALASRAQSRLSLARVLEGLDRFTLEVLDAVRLAADGEAAGLGAVQGLAGPVDGEVVAAAVGRLRALAVVYGPDEAIVPVRGLDELCGPYPAGLGRPAAELDPMAGQLAADPARLRRELLEAPPEARAVLERLAAGPPVGTVRAAAPDTPLAWLIDHHLLVRERVDTVQLPRELGLLLRRDTGPLGILHPEPPEPVTTPVAPAAVDAAGAGQAMEVLRLTAALLDATAAEPVPVLKSGGAGVLQVRRLARATGAAEDVVTLLLEVAWEAGLLATDPGAEQPVWLPTPGYDDWRVAAPAVRWQTLARAWLAMPRLPGLIGTRDLKDKPVNALSGDVSRMSAPVLRGTVLAALAGLPPGEAAGADELIALLSWRAPRRAGATADAARWALAEAATLGVTGRGALTAYGRAVLADDDAAVELLGELLPAPVTEVLLQADLTVVVPGPPEAALAAELELVADTESAGHATVYRVTPASVRRALDAGMSAADLHALFARRSTTPVPQALSYLVDDVARRHGGLRVGVCASYLRSEDTGLLAEVAADRRLAMLGLRSLAPTVLVSPYQPHRLLDALRDAGYTPVAEDGGGGVVVTTRPRLPRATGTPAPRRAARTLPEKLPVETLEQVVEAMRRGDEAVRTLRRPPVPDARSTADALAVLSQAVRAKQLIWVGYVDSHGGTAARLVRPVSIGSGYLRASDDRTETLHTFALHRITSATPAE
jgi:XPB/Ssl2-like helicase family protein